jgi:predicted peptidase
MTVLRPCVVAMLCVAASSFVRGGEDFEARVYKDAEGKMLPYRLLKAKDADAKQKYPLVVFLHGAGERGTDNLAQLKHCVRAFAKPENQAKYPCFVIAPQCPNNMQWVATPWGADSHIMPEKPTDAMRQALELIAALQKEFPIDPQRLYVMGLSMGGYGTWDAITRHPDMFAAAVPVCGGADETKAAAIAKVPVWVFHGDKDTVVKTMRARNIVEALKKAGGNPKYTEYPGVGHDSWNKAFAEPELFPWLFGQKKP